MVDKDGPCLGQTKDGSKVCLAMLNDGNHGVLGWLGTHARWVLKEGEGLGFRGPRAEQEESHPGPWLPLSHTCLKVSPFSEH